MNDKVKNFLPQNSSKPSKKIFCPAAARPIVHFFQKTKLFCARRYFFQEICLNLQIFFSKFKLV